MKKIVKAVLCAATVSILAPHIVYAGDINGNEQRVISAASGVFEYNGKKYVANSAYLAQLRAELASDGRDLTAEQAQSAIDQMYASVPNGVEQGYLICIDGSDETVKEGSTNKANTATTQETEKEEKNKDKNKSSNIENKSENKNENKQTETAGVNEKETTETGNEKITDASNSMTTVNEEKESITMNQAVTQREDSNSSITTKNPAETSEKETKQEQKTDQNRNNVWIVISIIAGLIVLIPLVVLIISKMRLRKWRRTDECMQYDIHSHVLPGVDDGARDLDMSMAMVDEAYSQGVRYMMATPHYTPGEHNPSVETLNKQYNKLQSAVKKKYPDMHIGLGNEVLYSPSVIKDLEENKIMLMPEEFTGLKGKTVLVEFSPKDDYRDIRDAVRKLTENLYTPIIAHVERYENVEAGNHYRELKELGAKLQVNVKSLDKASSKHYVKLSRKLIREGLIDYLGTDAHNVSTRAVDTKETVGFIAQYSSEEEKNKLLKNK